VTSSKDFLTLKERCLHLLGHGDETADQIVPAGAA
jgi:hypothetical protein